MEIFHSKGEGIFDKKYLPFIAFYLQNPKKTLEIDYFVLHLPLTLLTMINNQNFIISRLSVIKMLSINIGLTEIKFSIIGIVSMNTT